MPEKDQKPEEKVTRETELSIARLRFGRFIESGKPAEQKKTPDDELKAKIERIHEVTGRLIAGEYIR